MNTESLIWGLEELSDRGFQERVWTGKSDREVSSFIEAICSTFDDSGLGVVLEYDNKKSEISPSLHKAAVKLNALVKKVPQDLPPLSVINHPAMEAVREAAKEMLVILKV